MPNETSSDASVTQPSDLPVTGTPASPGVTPETKPNVTLEAALARIAELEHAHKNAREAEDRLGKKLSAYEKKEAEAEAAKKAAQEAELSELEREKKQRAELQSAHDAYTRRMQERIIRYEVEREAAKLNIIDPDAAVRLLDLSELEYDEQGTPTNADKLLEKLLKSKPYLAPKSEEPEPPARGNATPALPAMNPGRSQIAAPDSFPPGKIPRLSDVYRRP